MPVPPNEVQVRVAEVFDKINDDFLAWRDGKSFTSTMSKVLGFMNGKWMTIIQQSRDAKLAIAKNLTATAGAWIAGYIASLAQFGYILVHVPFNLSKTVHVPVVTPLTGLAKFAANKVFERGLKNALLPVFESKEPDSDELQMETEYVVMTLAQTVKLAMCKVEVAREKANNAYMEIQKQMNCKGFVNYLTACQYYYFRVDRLRGYHSLLQKWAVDVTKAVEDLHKECEQMQKDTFNLAKMMLSDYEPHLKCEDQQCLFNPEWMTYFVAPQRTGALVPEIPDPKFQRVGPPKATQPYPGLPSFKDPRPR